MKGEVVADQDVRLAARDHRERGGHVGGALGDHLLPVGPQRAEAVERAGSGELDVEDEGSGHRGRVSGLAGGRGAWAGLVLLGGAT